MRYEATSFLGRNHTFGAGDIPLHTDRYINQCRYWEQRIELERRHLNRFIEMGYGHVYDEDWIMYPPKQ